jgi:hypothetical protein
LIDDCLDGELAVPVRAQGQSRLFERGTEGLALGVNSDRFMVHLHPHGLHRRDDPVACNGPVRDLLVDVVNVGKLALALDFQDAYSRFNI